MGIQGADQAEVADAGLIAEQIVMIAEVDVQFIEQRQITLLDGSAGMIGDAQTG